MRCEGCGRVFPNSLRVCPGCYKENPRYAGPNPYQPKPGQPVPARPLLVGTHSKRRDMVECPTCGARVRQIRLERHMSRVHSTVRQSVPEAAPSTTPKVPVSVNPNKEFASFLQDTTMRSLALSASKREYRSLFPARIKKFRAFEARIVPLLSCACTDPDLRDKAQATLHIIQGAIASKQFQVFCYRRARDKPRTPEHKRAPELAAFTSPRIPRIVIFSGGAPGLGKRS